MYLFLASPNCGCKGLGVCMKEDGASNTTQQLMKVDCEVSCCAARGPPAITHPKRVQPRGVLLSLFGLLPVNPLFPFVFIHLLSFLRQMKDKGN